MSSEQDLARRRKAVEREMHRRRDAEERDDRELVDTVGDEQRERERGDEEPDDE